MSSITSSRLRPCLRANASSSSILRRTALRCGVPTTRMPRPRVKSSNPSSRRTWSARITVFLLTPITAAMSMAGARRSPGDASPSAMARRPPKTAATTTSTVTTPREALVLSDHSARLLIENVALCDLRVRGDVDQMPPIGGLPSDACDPPVPGFADAVASPAAWLSSLRYPLDLSR
jgi:hypothetical protein